MLGGEVHATFNGMFDLVGDWEVREDIFCGGLSKMRRN